MIFKIDFVIEGFVLIQLDLSLIRELKMKSLTLEGVMSVQVPNDAMASFLLWRETLK